jgi:hypothetical protein
VPEAEFLTRLVEHIGRAGTHAADNDLQIQPRVHGHQLGHFLAEAIAP